MTDLTDLNSILEERAARLAVHEEGEIAATRSRSLLVFQLGLARFGVIPEELGEVMPLPPLTPVPLAPPELAGLLNLRGVVVPAVDLGALVRLESQLFDRTALFLLGSRQRRIAVVVGKVVDLHDYPEDEFQEPPDSMPGGLLRFVDSVTRDGLVVLDSERLLSAPELAFQPRLGGA